MKTTVPHLATISTSAKFIFYIRIVRKAALLFVVFNLIFGLSYPISALGRFSAYNYLFPGRLRLPYGDNPKKAYNLSLFNLEAMFASHELSAGPKPASEYRVLLIGDSATWGFLVPADKTLAARLDQARIKLSDGRHVRFYNLGYPVMSLTKDLLIMHRARAYEPDLVIWLVTLESFPRSKQLFPPLLTNNPALVSELNDTYSLNLALHEAQFENKNFWSRTIIGARREIADILRLQFHGIMWAATGIDQEIPDQYTPRSEDLAADITYADWMEPPLPVSGLSLEIINAGVRAAQPAPILLVNEPMFISQGTNSDLRYNFYYPRWAYDDYRDLLLEYSTATGLHYLDLWHSLPDTEYSNTAVHRTILGEQLLAKQLLPVITKLAEQAQ